MNQRMSSALKQGDNTPVVLKSSNETVQIFENDLFGSVRFVEKNGKQFAVAIDVAKILKYKNPTEAVNDHCRRVEKGWTSDTLGRRQQVNIIPEGDIFRLITNSELPEAEKVESWIFDEILPTIRKHGVYITDEAYQEYLTNKPQFELRLKEAHEEIQALRLENKELEQANELLTNQYNDVRLMYQNCTNEVAEYVIDNLVYKKSGKVKTVELYNHYCRWCHNTPHYEPYDKKQFEELLLERMVQGHSIKKDGNYYLGIEVKKWLASKKDKAKIVIGDKDTVLHLKNGTFNIYSPDGKQTLSIEFKHEENLRTVIDMLNYLYYTRFYAQQIHYQNQKTIEAVNEFMNKFYGGKANGK